MSIGRYNDVGSSKCFLNARNVIEVTASACAFAQTDQADRICAENCWLNSVAKKAQSRWNCKRSAQPSMSAMSHLRSRHMAPVQVIGLVGSSRKRTLMLWQAVELSRVMDRPNLATLQIARKALEPPDDPFEQVPFIYYAVSCSSVLQCAVLRSAML